MALPMRVVAGPPVKVLVIEPRGGRASTVVIEEITEDCGCGHEHGGSSEFSAEEEDSAGEDGGDDEDWFKLPESTKEKTAGPDENIAVKPAEGDAQAHPPPAAPPPLTP
jgi:hypothetical protein